MIPRDGHRFRELFLREALLALELGDPATESFQGLLARLGKPLTMNIRPLFLERKRAYTLREAAAILAMTSRDLCGWIEAGELEGEETRDGLLLPWGELVSFAMDFWDQEEIERALGDDLPLAIPELVAARRASGAHPAKRYVEWFSRYLK